jgi:preprotein translocase subunit SecB
MSKRTVILINPKYGDLIADSILKMADEHKKNCIGAECTVTLFPLRKLVSQLLDRLLTDEELRILS